MNTMNTMNKVIHLEDVWKTYSMGEVKVHALRGVSLDIRTGEFVAIMGPSGSGKSTMVNMVGCLDIPTRGRIYLEGKDISSLSESDLAAVRGKKIGFIFQKLNLTPALSALENVALPMIFQAVPRETRLSRAKELLTLVDLGDRMSHRPAELSGGQQQRVAIARSLANDPDVILADEPTGNLDTKTGDTVIEFLKQLNKKEKKTVVMVTHDSNVAEHADRVEYLKDGKIVKSMQNNKGA